MKISIFIVTILFLFNYNLYADKVRIIKILDDEEGISNSFWENNREFLKSEEFNHRHKTNICFLIVSKEKNVAKEARFCKNWEPISYRIWLITEIKGNEIIDNFEGYKIFSIADLIFSQDNNKKKYKSMISQKNNGDVFKKDYDNTCKKLKIVNNRSTKYLKVNMVKYCDRPPRILIDWIEEIEMLMSKFSIKYNTDTRVWPHEDFKKLIQEYEMYSLENKEDNKE